MEWTFRIKEVDAVNLIGRTNGIELEMIAEYRREGDTIYFEGAHFTKNDGDRLHPRQLIEFGRDFLRQHGNGAMRLLIQGAERTTGANRGAVPKPILIMLE